MHYSIRSSKLSFNHDSTSPTTNTPLSSVVLEARPELSEPWVRVLRHILVQYRPVESRNAIAGDVVQRVLLIWAGTNGIRNGLDIVANLLIDHELDVFDLGVLDADLVAIVGADLGDDVRDTVCRQQKQ